MSAMASQITGASVVCSTVCSGADQRKHQSSASLAFVRESTGQRWISPHQRPVTRKKFLFDDVIMRCLIKPFREGWLRHVEFRQQGLSRCDMTYFELLLRIFIRRVRMMTTSNGKFSVLLALCAGNSPVTGEFSTKASDAGLWCFLWPTPE